MPSVVEAPPTLVYQFHVLLLHISPAIWRRILAPTHTTVAQLHTVLQICLGWSDSQPFLFALHGQQFSCPQPHSRRLITNAAGVLLSDWRLRPNERLLYSVGWLDRWRLQLRLENVLPYDQSTNYPCCLSGARQAPPEYCDGAKHFMDLCCWNTRERTDSRLLQIIALCRQQPEQIDNYRAEVRRLCYWLEVNHFDRNATNTMLQQLIAGTYSWPQADREWSQCRLK